VVKIKVGDKGIKYSSIMGKMLRVDLGRGIVQEEILPDEYAEKYVGGDGLAARIIYDEVPPGTGALPRQ